ncbi:MAG: hypothetical protein KF724_08140 [Phycisphaeraceae bacterium]|nr:hypothetical protein [Phycisphaeraceae bacterium]
MRLPSPLALVVAVGAVGTATLASARAQSQAPNQWQLEAQLEPDVGPPPSLLGPAVAINPKRAAVGNRRNHDTGSDSGVVHCFDLVRRAWRQSQLVHEPSGCITCDFGAALDMDADRMIVGAPRDGALGFEAGRAHIYLRRGTRWVLETTIARSKPSPGDLFGSDVSIAGRVAVVGMPYADLGPPGPGQGATPDCGGVEVFEFVGQRWEHVATLLPPTPATSGWFGAAVAVEGDLIAVGEHGHPDGLAAAGAVHLYRRKLEGWVHEQTIASPWPGAAWFGFALSIDGGRLLVGAPRAKAPGASAATGAAFLYERSGSSLTLSAALGAPWLQSGDGFGISVALDRETAVVGASGDDESGFDAGAIYFFTRSGKSFRPADKVLIPGVGEGDRAGARMGATRGRVIVGRGGDPELDPAPGDGAAWIFTSPTVSPPPRTTSVNPPARAPAGRRSQTRGRSLRATAREFRSG